MKNITHVIFTDKQEHSCPDLKLENWFNSIKLSDSETVYLSSDLQLTRLRVAVKEKEISPFLVVIESSPNKLHSTLICNTSGKLNAYPETLSTFCDLLRRL